MKTYTEQIADYVADTSFDALPESTVTAAKWVTLDLLGVVLPAINYGPGRVMNEYIRDTGGPGVATVVGTDIKTNAANAALANGTMAADMEQDDVHPESNLHASSVFVPAMLGVAEEIDASGRDWINALVVAYDVGCRLSIAMDNGRQYASGFHPTAVSGTFGASAAVARLLGLDADAVNSAIGLTGCQAAGMLTWEMETEHFTKSFQSGVPARNAVVAAQLAARGYSGARNTLDGKYNVFDAFSNHRNFPRLVENLGERHEIEYTGYKFYSVCRFIHSALDQLLDLSEEQGFGGEDIEKLDVWLPHTQVPIVDKNPLITHNLQYSLAVGITDRVVERAQTAQERFADPALQAIASRITLRGADDLEELYPAHWPSRISLTLTDGRTFESEKHDPRGTSFIPVAQEDIVAKFVGMASQVLPGERVNEIVKLVDELETLDSIRQLTALLVP
ncbi:MAG: MmgE/PrpD family protein [Nocardioides sp.]|nr:MmgE/PrpD family protein [Nocardioides sp.]